MSSGPPARATAPKPVLLGPVDDEREFLDWLDTDPVCAFTIRWCSSRRGAASPRLLAQEGHHGAVRN
jgi:hypothetical protein